MDSDGKDLRNLEWTLNGLQWCLEQHARARAMAKLRAEGKREGEGKGEEETKVVEGEDLFQVMVIRDDAHAESVLERMMDELAL